MKTIEIHWEGPFSIETIKGLKSDIDYGVYQIYGTHNIFGPNSLLYIGQANDQTFGKRLSQHIDWLEWEFSEVEIFIGKLGGTKTKKDEEWANEIDEAERLLIYYSSPPYNTKNLNSYGDINDTIVLNFGRKNMLPLEVSTFWKNSEFWDENSGWEEYKT